MSDYSYPEFDPSYIFEIGSAAAWDFERARKSTSALVGTVHLNGRLVYRCDLRPPHGGNHTHPHKDENAVDEAKACAETWASNVNQKQREMWRQQQERDPDARRP